MRRWTALCKDNKTGMIMIFSECSYNMACFQLEYELSKKGIILVSAKMDAEKGMMRIEFSNGGVFYYDEERCYLLKEDHTSPIGYPYFSEVLANG